MLLRWFSMAVASVLALASFARGSIIVGPLTMPGSDHYYYKLSQNTWTASEAEAQTMGGHLVTINNAAENAWVYSTFNGASNELWIGLNDAAHEGVWQYPDGTIPPYVNWYTGEPNGGTSENYVHMGPFSALGQWNDMANVGGFFNSPTNFFGIVEIAPPAAPIPEPASLFLISLGAMGIVWCRCTRR